MIQSVLGLLLCVAIRFKNFNNFLDRIPIAGSGRDAQKLLDFAEVADCLHLPSIKAQNEPVLDGYDLEQPLFVRWQTEGKRRRRRESFTQNVDEPGYLQARGLVCERIVRYELDDVLRGTNHDLTFERQFFCDSATQS